MSSFGEDFGQKVDLTASIRNILRNYPEGTAILKELVQNADDANAKVVRFCLDYRHHNCEKLPSSSLEQFQGPSLLVFNDAVFTEEDFKSIQRIGDSLKNSEDESKTKIGRFGIGFNAVYHWTELPTFISDQYLVMLDPQARFLPNVNPSNPGKIVNWIKNKNLLKDFEDQFSPYKIPELVWNKPFQGTLFRLPLRTSLQAESSLLSKRSLSIEDTRSIIHSLIEEATTMLLFLRHVEKIEIQEWLEGETQPRLIYNCQISNITPKIRTQRSFDVVLGKNRGTSLDPNKVLCEDFTLEISIEVADQSKNLEIWEVCNQLGGKEATSLARNPRNAHLKFVPLAGVAACVLTSAIDNENRKGLAYCFLPLPIKTNLPIMVNGFFELSSNRRDLWQSGGDMTGDGMIRANWNIALLRDVISPSYVRLLLKLKGSLGFSQTFERFWPNKKFLSNPWTNVLQSTLELAKNEKLMAISNGFANSKDETPIWIETQTAVLIPLELNQIFENADIELYQILKHFGAKVVNLKESFLHETLIQSNTCPIVATPNFVRDLMRSNSQIFPLPPMCKFLLQYCISDLPNKSLSPELLDLSLLPLTNTLIGKLKIYSQSQMKSILHLSSMGYSLNKIIDALQSTQFNIDRACDSLANTQNDISSKRTIPLSMFVVANIEEFSVFEKANQIFIDQNLLDSNEIDILENIYKQNNTLLNQRKYFSNVWKFSPELIPDILNLILPQSCSEGRIVPISFLSDPIAQDLKEFIRNFWKYASNKEDVVSSVVESVSIIQSSRSPSYFPISRLSNIICPSRGDQTLSELLQNALSTLGIPILDVASMNCQMSTFPIIFWDYIHPPTRKGVISTISYVHRNSSNTEIIDLYRKLSNLEKDELRTFLSQGSTLELSDDDCDFINSMPIFPIFTTEYNSNSQASEKIVNYSSLNAKKVVGDELFTLKDFSSIPDLFYPKNMIFHSTSQELQLLIRLKLKMLSKGEFIRKFFLSRSSYYFDFSPSEYNNFLIQILLELKTVLKDEKSLIQDLKLIACLPHDLLLSTDTGIDNNLNLVSVKPLLKRINELFDPRDPDLSHLLDFASFPAREFQTEDILVILTSLGLKSSIDWDGIIECALSIQSYNQSTHSEIKSKRSRNLFNYLNKNLITLLGEEKKGKPSANNGYSFFQNITNLFSEKSDKEIKSQQEITDYISRLKSIAWVPVLMKPNKSYLPWPKSQSPLEICSSPNNCILQSDIWFYSSTKRVIDSTGVSSRMIQIFDWEIKDDIPSLLIQFKSIEENFRSLVHESPEKLEMVRLLPTILPIIYQKLDNSDPQHSNIIISSLENTPWIWINNEFIEANRVALSCSVNAAPYLINLPEDIKNFKHLLSLFKIKSSFTFRDYIEALRMMAIDSGFRSPEVNLNSSTSNQGNVLNEINLDIAISLVSMLAVESKQTLHSNIIFVPDSQGRLFPSNQLIHDDVPWLVGPEFVTMRSSRRLVHGNISSQVAEKIGVQSLRLSLINQNIEQNLFGISDSSAIQSFGQAESLTNRLKTILDLYPDGSPILNELIQNADDAGATIIRILIDENIYDHESLMDARMESLQGPALIVQNNATFTEADFKSLASVGQGSKLEKLASTGRFGLGFNSTYHITDTPTLISGEYLVIFDPHCSYVPGATPNQPGIRIKFPGNNLHKIFPNQFEPYFNYGFNCEDKYNGTLFRFPLRNAFQAKRSEICKRSYQLNDVESLINQLIDQLSYLMLFLRNIEQIEICRFPEKSSGNQNSIQLIQRASLKTKPSPSYLSLSSDPLLLKFIQMQAGVKAITRDEFSAKLLSTPDDKLPILFSNRQITVENYSSVNQSSQKPSEKITEYEIISGLGGGKAKLLAGDNRTRHLKLIPYGNVAICLSEKIVENNIINIIEFPNISGKTFSFLPLPINNSLPIHLNAYWELSSNRRDIWRGEGTQGDAKLRSDWNECIMKDILAPLYSKLLYRIKIILEEKGIDKLKPEIILNLLPNSIPSPPFDTLAQSLFPLLSPSPLLYTPMSGGTFIQCGKALLMENIQTKKFLERIEHLLLTENLPIVKVPQGLIEPMLTFNCSKQAVNPKFIRKLFQSKVFENRKFLIFDSSVVENIFGIPGVQASRFNAFLLLSYCISDLTSKDFSNLLGLRLLPLINGDLGTLEDPMDAKKVYYFVEDSNLLVLLEKASDRIVIHSNIAITQNNPNSPTWGKEMYSLGLVPWDQCFKDLHLFENQFNLKKIEAIDVLKIICSILPSDWLIDSSLFVINPSHSILNIEWLNSFWQYILSNKLLDLYRGVIPMIPCVVIEKQDNTQTPITWNRSQLLVKLNLNSISIIQCELTNDFTWYHLTQAFRDLGIFVLDDSKDYTFLHNPEFKKNLFLPGGEGIISSLCLAKDKILNKSQSWSKITRYVLYNYIIKEILPKVSTPLNPSQQEVLFSLPIWMVNNRSILSFPNFSEIDSTLDPILLNDISFQSISTGDNSIEYYLPPKDIPQQYLGSQYLTFRNSTERNELQSKLKIKEMNIQDFILKDIFLRLELQYSLISDEELSWMNKFILSNYNSIQSEAQKNLQVQQWIKSLKYIKNGDNKFCSSQELYDPNSSTLTSFLHSSFFPHQSIMQDQICSYHLKLIGLKKDVDLETILAAAKTIEKQQLVMMDDMRSQISSSESLVHHKDFDKVYQSSKGLFQYLEKNIENILPPTDIENEKYKSFIQELLSISWLSVYSKCPEHLMDRAIPWPRSVHAGKNFASPSSTTILRNIYFSSATLRIFTMDIQSKYLISIFGWDNPLRGITLASQLIHLSNEYQLLNDKPEIRNKYRNNYDEIYPSLLSKLFDAFSRENNTEKTLWIKLLESKPILWIQPGVFVEANRSALNPLPGLNTDPFLFVVPTYMQQYKDLLISLGVRQSFIAEDIAYLTRAIYSDNQNKTLSSDSLCLIIGIINVLYQLLKSEHKSVPEISENLEHGNELDPEEVEETIVLEDSDDFNLSPERISTLGLIYLPDTNNQLFQATSMAFNDAVWISSANTLFIREHNIHIVHNQIDIKLAKLFGAQSLRELMFTSEELFCPSAKDIHSFIDEDSLIESLNEITYLADQAECNYLEFIYDNRMHPSESLLHTGLSTLQGTSILAHFHQTKLSFDQIKTWLSLPFTSKTSPIKHSNGKGLVTCFSITDCIQIFTGSELYFFDPLGCYLVNTILNPTNNNIQHTNNDTGTEPKAQRFKFSKTSNFNSSDLLSSFQDQFLPFLEVLDENLKREIMENRAFPGTIIRLPLRNSQSPTSANKEINLSKRFISMEDIKFTFSIFKQSMVNSLLFSNLILQNIALSHIFTGESIVKVDVSLSVHSDLNFRRSRKQYIHQSGWEKQASTGILGFFQANTPFAPPSEQILNVQLNWIVSSTTWLKLSTLIPPSLQNPRNNQSTSLDSFKLTETWNIYTCLGYNPLKDLACSEPYKSNQLIPFVSIAWPVLADILLCDHSIPPPLGLYGSTSLVLGKTGLPFHINAHFITPSFNPKNLAVHRGSISSHKQSTPGSLQRMKTEDFQSRISIVQSWNEQIFILAVKLLYSKALIDSKVFVEQRYQKILTSTSIDHSLAILTGFYKYWIYLPRISSKINRILTTNYNSSIYSQTFTKDNFYLIHPIHRQLPNDRLFDSLVNVMFLSDSNQALNFLARNHLQKSMKLVIAPLQLGQDLLSLKLIPPSKILTPALLREDFLRNISFHYRQLVSKSQDILDISLSLFSYVVQDILPLVEKMDSLNITNKKKMYQSLCGGTMVILSSGIIKVIPRSSSEQIVFGPKFLYHLVPTSLKDSMIIPNYIINNKKIFNDTLFQEITNITPFNCQYIRKFITHFIPESLLNELKNPDADYGILLNYNPQSESNSTQGFYMSFQFEIFLYALWNEILSSIPLDELLRNLGDLPLLPVEFSSPLRRLLIPVNWIRSTLLVKSMSVNDLKKNQDKRNVMRQEIIKYEQKPLLIFEKNIFQTLNPESSTSESISTNTIEEDSWKWITLPSSKPTNEKDGEDEINEEIVVDEELINDEFKTPEPPVENIVSSPEAVSVLSTSDKFFALEEDDPLLAINSSSDLSLYDLLYSKLGVPVLDRSIFYRVPKSIIQAFAGNQDEIPEPFSIGRVSLQVLSHLVSNPVLSSKYLSAIKGLNEVERQNILLEIFLSHQTEAFSDDLRDILKTLPLFTEAFYHTAIALISIDPNSPSTSPSYYFTSSNQNALFELYSLFTSSVGFDSSWRFSLPLPKLLKSNNNDLLSIYQWLEIQEIDPTKLIIDHILPLFRNNDTVLTNEQRKSLLTHLNKNWEIYSQSPELKQALTDTPLIPSWQYFLPDAWITNPPSSTIYRKCNELLLWTNKSLYNTLTSVKVEALQNSIPDFYPPPQLQGNEYLVLFKALGMNENLTEDILLNILYQIDDIALSLASSNDFSDLKVHCIKLVNYLFGVGGSTSTVNDLFVTNNSLLKKISTIHFIPMQKPVNIKSNGHVVFDDYIGSYAESVTVLQSKASYSVKPILSASMTPPNYYLSSLGIQNHIDSKILIQHLKKLSETCTTIDGFNLHEYFNINDAFKDIFEYIRDHEVQILEQISIDELKRIIRVPIEDQLFLSPEYLFSSSATIISRIPTLFPLPKNFESFEPLFLKLGMKKTLQTKDYLSFLRYSYNMLQSQDSEEKTLNYNELVNIQQIVKFLFSEIFRYQLKSSFQSESKLSLTEDDPIDLIRMWKTLTEKIDSNRDYLPIYLPDLNDKMRDLRQLYIINDENLFNQLVANTGSNKLAISSNGHELSLYPLHPTIQSILTESTESAEKAGLKSQFKWNIHNLTDIIQETISPSCIITEELIFSSHANEINQFNSLINSVLNNPRGFAKMLATFLSSISHLSITNRQISLSLSEIEISEQLSQLQIKFISFIELEYNLLINNDSHGLRIPSSKPTHQLDSLNSSSILYLDLKYNVLYFNHSMISSLCYPFELVYSLGLCQLFKLDKIFTLNIYQLLLTSLPLNYSKTIPDSYSDFLARIIYPSNLPDPENIKGTMGIDSLKAVSKLDPLRGQVGSLLSPKDLTLIEINPFKYFFTNEIVAYLDQDTIDGPKQYYYAKILNTNPSSSISKSAFEMKKIEVLLKPNVIQTLLTTEIYPFKSWLKIGEIENSENENSNFNIFSPISSFFSSNNNNKSSLLKQSKPQSQTSSQPQIEADKKDNNELSQVQNKNEKKRKEIMDSIDRLMNLAGLPPSLQEKHMMSKILDLEGSKKELEELLEHERVQQIEATKAYEESVNSYKCSICLTNFIEQVLIPCGHAFCEQCVGQLRNNKCHYCRGSVQKKVKLFL